MILFSSSRRFYSYFKYSITLVHPINGMHAIFNYKASPEAILFTRKSFRLYSFRPLHWFNSRGRNRFCRRGKEDAGWKNETSRTSDARTLRTWSCCGSWDLSSTSQDKGIDSCVRLSFLHLLDIQLIRENVNYSSNCIQRTVYPMIEGIKSATMFLPVFIFELFVYCTVSIPYLLNMLTEIKRIRETIGYLTNSDQA